DSGRFAQRCRRRGGDYVPEMVIEATRKVGAAVEVFSSRSSATASMPSSIVSRSDEMVTSPTGNAILPSSIQKPAAPREKSPVTALKPKPIISVTKKPRGVEAMSSLRDREPGCMMKLLVDEPIDPPLRAALAVGWRSSLRAA